MYVKYATVFALLTGFVFSGFGSDVFTVPEQEETIPAVMRENPFVDSNPEPKITAEEKQNGLLFFSRPLTDPVYPGTRPLTFERTDELTGFGARGQYVNLNFSIYPLRGLRGLEVSDSGGAGKRELRRVVYWNIRYPYYTTQDAYRRTPEYLFPQSAPFFAPKHEPQRFLLTVRIPDDAPAGTIKGNLRISYAGMQKALELPYRIKVLPFKLERDPDKHFTAYSYPVRIRSHEVAGKHWDDEQWMHRAAVNQYRRMVEYGFTMPPFLYLRYKSSNGGCYEIPNLDKMLAEMKEAGLPTPLLIVGGCSVGRLYRIFTGKKLGRHLSYGKPPPEEMYQKIDSMLKAFLKRAKEKHYPPMIFAPLDEPSPGSLTMARRIYKIFKDNGCRTYMTSCPYEDQVSDVVDYWSDQPFRSYAEVMKKDKKAYWCYPNHNAYEIKDVPTMTRGGRMTYGFGLWKSGYNYLIPWIWQEYFNRHLRTDRRGGGGNYLAADGSTVMTVYWECFREGIIDGEYIYTLSNAIVQREPAKNPKLAALLKQGRELLQKCWNSIPPFAKYLADGHFVDEEFDGRRAEIAALLIKILKYPPSNSKTAPSVIIDPFKPPSASDFGARCEAEKKRGNLKTRPIPFDQWRACESEAKLSSPAPGVIRMRIVVDSKHDGTGNHGKYLLGWPRMRTRFGGIPVDFNDYDFLTFRLKVSSNRDGETAIRWPMYMTLASAANKIRSRGFTLFNRVEPGEWKTYVFPLDELRKYFKQTEKGFSQVSLIQFGISEHAYRHGDDLTFDFADIALVGLKAPAIRALRISPVVESSRRYLPWRLIVMGNIPPGLCVEQKLFDSNGKCVISGTTKLHGAETAGALPIRTLKSGKYQLEVLLREGAPGGITSKKVISSIRKPLEIVQLE